jgi:hypothetical protein
MLQLLDHAWPRVGTRRQNATDMPFNPFSEYIQLHLAKARDAAAVHPTHRHL